MRQFPGIACAVLLFSLIAAPLAAYPQFGGSHPTQQDPSNSQTFPHFPGDVVNEIDPARENSRQRAREKDRQRRIVDDANRLVKLTAQYRNDVEKHGSVTPEDQKLLVEIEKLAREVKDRMRGM